VIAPPQQQEPEEAESAAAAKGGRGHMRVRGAVLATARLAGLASGRRGGDSGRVGFCDKFCALLRCGFGRAAAADR
jgi:hypothetical protein